MLKVLLITTIQGHAILPFGNNAVFVAKVISRNEDRTTGDFSQQKLQITNALKQNASISAYNAIKENAGIVDNRNDFYQEEIE